MNHFSHLTDDELIAHHYGEAGADANAHLAACAACATRSESLKSDLAQLHLKDAPAPAPDFPELIWSRIRAEILSTPVRRFYFFPRAVALRYAVLAATCAVIVIAAFIAGRYSKRIDQQPVQSAHTNTPIKPNATTKQPVVVVVLADHLDRSEQFLVELKHTDAGDESTLAPMREEAKALLVANRKIIQQPATSKEPEMQVTLTKLDHLLVKLTADTDNFTAEDLDELKSELDANQLLFEIRVLRTTSQAASDSAHHPGASERHGGSI